MTFELDTAEPEALDIETILQWNAFKTVQNRLGFVRIRSAPVNDAFWSAYRARSADFKALGIEVKQNKFGSWSVVQHAPLSDDEQAERDAALAMSTSAESSLFIPTNPYAPFQPYSYQVAGAAYAIRRSAALIGDPVGLGKTYQAILVANGIKARKILVICPPTLRRNWAREIESFQAYGLTIGIAKPGKHGVRTLPPTGWVIMADTLHHTFEEPLRDQKWDLIIWDEAHRGKTKKSRRTKHITGNAREGITPLAASVRVALTATPLVNGRPREIWPLIHWLRPDVWNNEEAFLDRYASGMQTDFGYTATGEAGNLDELQDELRRTVLVRRDRAQVLKEMPAMTTQLVVLDNDGAEREISDEHSTHNKWRSTIEQLIVRRELAKASEDTKEYSETVKQMAEGERMAFAEMSRARIAVAMKKLPAVIAYVESVIDSGEKILVFANHKQVVAKLLEAFPGISSSIAGNVPMSKRQNIVDSFNDPNSVEKVMVLNWIAGGTGLNIHKDCHLVAFAELSFVPSDMDQAAGRVWRLGQTEHCHAAHLVLDGSLDQRIAKMLVDKQNNITAALDGRGEGTESGAHGDDSVDTRPMVEQVFEIDHGATVSTTRDQIAEDAAWMTDDFKDAIHTSLRFLVGLDVDRAQLRNGQGFDKIDGMIGRELARVGTLNFRQASLGLRISRKYAKQLPADLVSDLKRASTAMREAREASKVMPGELNLTMGVK